MCRLLRASELSFHCDGRRVWLYRSSPVGRSAYCKFVNIFCYLRLVGFSVKTNQPLTCLPRKGRVVGPDDFYRKWLGTVMESLGSQHRDVAALLGAQADVLKRQVRPPPGMDHLRCTECFAVPRRTKTYIVMRAVMLTYVYLPCLCAGQG